MYYSLYNKREFARFLSLRTSGSKICLTTLNVRRVFLTQRRARIKGKATDIGLEEEKRLLHEQKNDIFLATCKTTQARGPARGVSQVACRNFKMSRVGILSRLHNAVGNLATYICLRQSFVAISFERCRYFLAHVACRNLPWQGLRLHFGLVACTLVLFPDMFT